MSTSRERFNVGRSSGGIGVVGMCDFDAAVAAFLDERGIASSRAVVRRARTRRKAVRALGRDFDLQLYSWMETDKLYAYGAKGFVTVILALADILGTGTEVARVFEKVLDGLHPDAVARVRRLPVARE